MTAIPLGAHGLVDEQIAEVAEQLEASPHDAKLLMRRATLHRAHGDYDAARADLQAIGKKSSRYLNAQLALARLEREHGHPANGAAAMARFFAAGGDTPEAWREKARIDTAMGRPEAAADAWRRFLARAGAPTAAEFLAAAESHLAASSLDPHLDGLAVAMDGLTRHPRSIPLHQWVASFDIRRAHLPAAEQRFADLRTMYPSLLPRLLYEEGLIWRAGNRPANAQAAYRLALHHLDQLPPRKQAQAGFQELRKLLNDATAPDQ